MQRQKGPMHNALAPVPSRTLYCSPCSHTEQAAKAQEGNIKEKPFISLFRAGVRLVSNCSSSLSSFSASSATSRRVPTRQCCRMSDCGQTQTLARTLSQNTQNTQTHHAHAHRRTHAHYRKRPKTPKHTARTKVDARTHGDRHSF